MAAKQYFAYGSNMLTERLLARCPSARPRQVVWADKYELTFWKKSIDGSGKATLFSRPTTIGLVFGVVFDLDESELPKLDEAEGTGYDRVDDFQVMSAGCQEPLKTVTYIANTASINRDLKPYDWYLSLVVAGARQHELPPQYIEEIESMPSCVDTKLDRKSRLQALKLLARNFE